MSGIKKLNELIKSMKPQFVKGEFVFCTINEETFSKLKFRPLLFFLEKEGITLVIRKEEADMLSIPYSGVWALITLTVHSDLKAVGFLAKISNELAKENISMNVVSAFYHDHLFVPIEKSDRAMDVLLRLSDLKGKVVQ